MYDTICERVYPVIEKLISGYNRSKLQTCINKSRATKQKLHYMKIDQYYVWFQIILTLMMFLICFGILYGLSQYFLFPFAWIILLAPFVLITVEVGNFLLFYLFGNGISQFLNRKYELKRDLRKKQLSPGEDLSVEALEEIHFDTYKDYPALIGISLCGNILIN